MTSRLRRERMRDACDGILILGLLPSRMVPGFKPRAQRRI